MNNATKLTTDQDRILSIDFFRGLVLFILVTGISGLFSELVKADMGGPIIAAIQTQFAHGTWYELYFWDLIQPFFMFIVGVALPFSVAKRLKRGDSWKELVQHALKRSFWLLVFGFMLGAREDSYFFTNILPQLAFTYPIAFLLLRKDIKWQLLISFVVILISDLFYQFWPIEGFNQLEPGANFGSWLDLHTTGHLHPSNWVTFNALSTLAHVLWGVVAGKVLMKDWPQQKKLLTILIPGVMGVLIGYAMRPYIPIIERISTSSYVIVSGGWALIAMSISYWLIDMLKFVKIPRLLAIFGMNSIFLYLFSQLGGGRMFHRMITPFTSRLFNWAGPISIYMIDILLVAIMFWFLAYFLYKRKIFIKL